MSRDDQLVIPLSTSDPTDPGWCEAVERLAQEDARMRGRALDETDAPDLNVYRVWRIAWPHGLTRVLVVAFNEMEAWRVADDLISRHRCIVQKNRREVDCIGSLHTIVRYLAPEQLTLDLECKCPRPGDDWAGPS